MIAATMKVILYAAVLTLFLAVTAADQRNTRTWGTLGNSDILLKGPDRIQKSWSFARRVSATVSYNDPAYIVTFVEAYDNWGDGTGGSAEITSGNVNRSDVTVKVTSKLSRGFDFTISIYGRRR